MLRNGLYFIGIPRSGPTGDKRRVSRSLGRMGRLYGAVQKRGQKPLSVPALFRKGVSCAACCLERRDVKTGVGACFLRERSGASCRRFFRTRERQRFDCRCFSSPHSYVPGRVGRIVGAHGPFRPGPARFVCVRGCGASNRNPGHVCGAGGQAGRFDPRRLLPRRMRSSAAVTRPYVPGLSVASSTRTTRFGSFRLRSRALCGRPEFRWCLRGRWAGGPVRLPVFSSAAYDLLRECRTRFCLFAGQTKAPLRGGACTRQKVSPCGNTFGSIRSTLLAESFSEQAVHQHQVDVFTDDLAGKKLFVFQSFRAERTFFVIILHRQTFDRFVYPNNGGFSENIARSVQYQLFFGDQFSQVDQRIAHPAQRRIDAHLGLFGDLFETQPHVIAHHHYFLLFGW